MVVLDVLHRLVICSFSSGSPPQIVAWSGVSARHSFHRAILHVWCETARIAGLMQQMFPGQEFG